MVETTCPACAKNMRIHQESIELGLSIVCKACEAILQISSVSPISLSLHIETEIEDLLHG